MVIRVKKPQHHSLVFFAQPNILKNIPCRSQKQKQNWLCWDIIYKFDVVLVLARHRLSV